MQKKMDRVAIGVAGCFVAFLAVLIATVAGGFLWLRPRAAGSASGSAATTATSTLPVSVSTSTSPTRRPWEPIPAEPCAAAPGTANELTEPLRIHDPAKIDLAELHDQARSLVLRLEPNAKLVTISALKEATGGTFDSAEGNFSFNYEYRCLRPGAPPGQDLLQGMLLVFAQGGTVRASRVPVPEAPTLAYRGALPEPPCSTVAAWTTAVASGVPANAHATFLYMEATGSGGGASWLVTVPGHPFKREIDGLTCRLRSNSASHPDLTDPGAELPNLHPTALPASSAVPVVPSAEPTNEPRPGPLGDLEWELPIEAGDMTAVDLGTLFSQARVVAERLQPGAQFTGISALETTHGKVDLTGDGRVVYKFEIAGHDPSQPPGKDTIERKIDVTAQNRRLHGVRRAWPATQLKHFGGPMEPPVCTSSQAWDAAVKSGVPENAVATVEYYDHTPFKAGGPWVWSLRVAGHDDYRREIDGKTCAMIKSWGAPTPSGSDGRSGGAAPVVSAPKDVPGSGGCTLNMNSIPPSDVALDGRPLGTTPRMAVPASCGAHVIGFVHPERGKKTVSITLIAGKPGSVSVRF